jgi:probable F420-dependent oxidoreductase
VVPGELSRDGENMKKLRFGVMADDVRTTAELVTLARWAEQAGFSTLLLRDHVVPEPFGDQLGPLTAMTVAAKATTSLRIGSLVIANDFRPPVQLAREIATIDQLSGGRVELGLGAGFLRAEYAPLGITFDSPGVRVSRLAEAIRLLRQLFSGDPVSFHGAYYQVENYTSFPIPPQRENLPLLVAGSGDRMLSLAAREADIVGLQTVTTTTGTVVADPENWLAETVLRKVDLLARVARNRFEHLELNSTITMHPCPDREAGAREIIAQRGWEAISSAQVLGMPAFLIGANDEIIAQIRHRHTTYGLSYLVVSQAQAPLLAPLISALR